MQPNLMFALGGCALGYLLPGMVLARHGQAARSTGSASALPDALDLLVVSVEAGLGLDQAIQRVGAELDVRASRSVRRAAADQPRAARRQGARPRRCATSPSAPASTTSASLVAMLVQTDKFGTSVAQSLRVHSETLRTKRRQRAEEAAAKTGVKMVFPLVFCIFPAIWVVTIGPAAIKFVTVLFPMVENIEVTAMTLIATNTNTGVVVADNVAVASTRAARAVGLLGRSGLDAGEALWIVPSRGVHTWGMRFAIDVVALDERGVVVDRVSRLKPWRIRLPQARAPPASSSCRPARSPRRAPRSVTSCVTQAGSRAAEPGDAARQGERAGRSLEDQ